MGAARWASTPPSVSPSSIPSSCAETMYKHTWSNHGSLGLQLQQRRTSAGLHVEVALVKTSSLPPEIREGLILVSLNDESILDLPFDDVVHRIRTAERPLTIEFAEPQLDAFGDRTVSPFKMTKADQEREVTLFS